MRENDAKINQPTQKGRAGSRRRSSLWTPANIVTVVRILALPFWIVVAELAVPTRGTGDVISASSMAAAIFYIILSATDKLDGYLARSRNEVTNFGKFLDPIADKLVVVVALIYLLEQGLVPMWMIVVVIAREFIISGLRMVVASSGVVIAAGKLGKYKTASTMAAICGYLIWLACPAGSFVAPLYWFSTVLMYIAIVLTAWSGIDYLVKSKDCLLEEESGD